MSRSRSGSRLSGPDKPLIVACKQFSEGILSKATVKDIFLWIDVAGVKFIESNTRRVQWFTPFNEITIWAVDGDVFKLRLLDKKGKLKDKMFLCGSQKALSLKQTMEEMVKMYLHQPDLVAELQKVAADFPVGSILPKDELEAVDHFGAGSFVDPGLADPKQASRRVSRFGGASLSSDGGSPNISNEHSGETSSSSSTIENITSTDHDIWKSEPVMKGFPAKLIEMSVARQTVTDVIVIIKDNGVHTINKNTKQGQQQQRTFSFSHKQIVKTKVVGDEFRFIVKGSDGATSVIRYLFNVEDNSKNDDVRKKVVEALDPFFHLRPIEKPPPAPRRAPPMFDDEGFEEQNEAEDESYRVSQRVQNLAEIMQDCLQRLGGLTTEESLLSECMDFMEKLNSFIVEGGSED